MMTFQAAFCHAHAMYTFCAPQPRTPAVLLPCLNVIPPGEQNDTGTFIAVGKATIRLRPWFTAVRIMAARSLWSVVLLPLRALIAVRARLGFTLAAAVSRFFPSSNQSTGT